MEKRSIYYEFILKCVFFLISFIMAIFTILNVIKIVPLLQAYSISNEKLYSLFFKTDVGNIFTHMVVFEDSNFFTMLNEALNALIISLKWIDIGFLLLFGILLIAAFIYPKWKLVNTYLKLSAFLIIAYLLRYISFALCVLYFFKDSVIGLTNGLFFGTIFYLLFCLSMIFIMSLFMIKFIFNVYFDVKNIMSLE